MMQQLVSDTRLRRDRLDNAVRSGRSASQRPRVLVTGFGPFPGQPENITSRLVPDLAAWAQGACSAFETKAAILPTEWDRAPARLDRLLDTFQPSVVLLFGVSARARGFEVETVARNAADAALDAAGMWPAAPRLDPTGLDQLAARLPAARIVAHLRRLRVPARMSRDAGGYLCNASLYHLLNRSITPTKPRVAGFVHVPANLRMPRAPSRLDYESALSGAQAILSVCLGRDVVSPSNVRRRGLAA